MRRVIELREGQRPALGDMVVWGGDGWELRPVRVWDPLRLHTDRIVRVVTGPWRSANFVTGSTGWALEPDGSAEFNDVEMRSPNFVAGSAGWLVKSDGSVEFNDVTMPGVKNDSFTVNDDGSDVNYVDLILKLAGGSATIRFHKFGSHVSFDRLVQCDAGAKIPAGQGIVMGTGTYIGEAAGERIWFTEDDIAFLDTEVRFVGNNVLLHTGADLVVYSDAGVTEKARIDGATGDITTAGNLEVGGTTKLVGNVGFFNTAPQAKQNVLHGNVDGEIGGLSIGATYSQAEVQALRDKCEELADDVRSLRGGLVTYGLVAEV